MNLQVALPAPPTSRMLSLGCVSLAVTMKVYRRSGDACDMAQVGDKWGLLKLGYLVGVRFMKESCYSAVYFWVPTFVTPQVAIDWLQMSWIGNQDDAISSRASGASRKLRVFRAWGLGCTLWPLHGPQTQGELKQRREHIQSRSPQQDRTLRLSCDHTSNRKSADDSIRPRAGIIKHHLL